MNRKGRRSRCFFVLFFPSLVSMLHQQLWNTVFSGHVNAEAPKQRITWLTTLSQSQKAKKNKTDRQSNIQMRLRFLHIVCVVLPIKRFCTFCPFSCFPTLTWCGELQHLLHFVAFLKELLQSYTHFILYRINEVSSDVLQSHQWGRSCETCRFLLLFFPHWLCTAIISKPFHELFARFSPSS